MPIPTFFLTSTGPTNFIGRGLQAPEAAVTSFVEGGRVVQDVVNLSQRAASLLGGSAGASQVFGDSLDLHLAPVPPFVIGGGRAVSDVIDLSQKVLKMLGGGFDPAAGDGFSAGAKARQAVPESTVTGVNEPGSGLYLAGTDYQYNRLSGANFYWSDLDDATFKGAELTNARFDNASLENAIFTRSDLRGASFSHADVSGADFTAADLRGADLRHASNLTATQLRYAVVDGTTLLPMDLQYLAVGRL